MYLAPPTSCPGASRHPKKKTLSHPIRKYITCRGGISKCAGPLAQGVLDLQLGSSVKFNTWKSRVKAIRPGIPPIGHPRLGKCNRSEHCSPKTRNPDLLLIRSWGTLNKSIWVCLFFFLDVSTFCFCICYPFVPLPAAGHRQCSFLISKQPHL